MKEFLVKLKLIDTFTTELEISGEEFIEKLSAITDNDDLGPLSDTFDAFSSTKNEFKGLVDINGFKLKRRRKFFDSNMNIAVANGIIKEQQGHLIIDTEINGFNNMFIFSYIIIFIFYSISLFGIVSSGNNKNLIAIPFLLLHGTFMSLIPYFMMRRSVKRLKYELEREFFYLTKNNKSFK